MLCLAMYSVGLDTHLSFWGFEYFADVKWGSAKRVGDSPRARAAHVIPSAQWINSSGNFIYPESRSEVRFLTSCLIEFIRYGTIWCWHQMRLWHKVWCHEYQLSIYRSTIRKSDCWFKFHHPHPFIQSSAPFIGTWGGTMNVRMNERGASQGQEDSLRDMSTS